EVPAWVIVAAVVRLCDAQSRDDDIERASRSSRQTELGEVERLEQLECVEQLRTRLWRWRGQHGATIVRDAVRPLPLRFEAGEVIESGRMSTSVEHGDELAACASCVEAGTAILCNVAQCRCKLGVAVNIAG